MTRKCGGFVSFIDILWGYPHITVCEHQTARAQALYLCRLQPPVRRNIGHALHEVQSGGEPLSAKALKGFGGRTILEIIDDFDGNTFRAVYTVRFAGVVYVLHAFQKKSKKGIATPKRDIELIKARLRDAEELHRARTEQGGGKP
jgi:phage-related protein